MNRLDLSIPALRARYLDASLTPEQLVGMLHEQMLIEDVEVDRHMWIHRLTLEQMRAHARALQGRDARTLPLYGIPFAIKDNIDLAGIATTAGCAAFAYTPEISATVVQRLIDAGAIPVGKTNLDQFATGLVGVRSPYGACRNSFDPNYVSGGSSSGSAVTVALGLASFSLGTDTAGSGRVPAMFNNLIGLKPTCGRIPTTGVVPACKTLDAISVFALTAADAATVLHAAQGEDPADAYSRTMPAEGDNFGVAERFCFGIPRQCDLAFHGNLEGPAQFAQAVAHLVELGGTPVEIDLTPFREAATLLYEGPWIAERYQVLRSLIETQPEAMHPVTRAITEKGAQFSAADTFAAFYRLKELQRQTRPVWNTIDCLVTPTASTHYTIAAVQADPIRLNSNLGYYTNFVNLLDLSAVAVPTGFMRDASAGLPWGVTLVAQAGQDFALLSLAARLHARSVNTVGSMQHAPHRSASAISGASMVAPISAPPSSSGQVRIAVCGAHMSGLPLNQQLTQRGAQPVRSIKSASCYKLFALPGGPPKRPGMLRVETGGAAIDMEVWEMPVREFGSFVAGIPAPLGIGTVVLEDGTQVQGFVCESHATAQAQDITHFGGWRAYLVTERPVDRI